MKKITLAIVFATVFFSFTSMGQTGQWKLAGNNLTGTEKLGSTNNQDVRFLSNNVVNGVLTKSGTWGFGTTSPSAKLHINSASGQDPFRVQVNSDTKLHVSQNGGVSVGNSVTHPSSGLFVSGNAGIGVTSPISKLHVSTGSSGTSPFANSIITLENSSNNYISLLTPNATESGILFGNPSSNVSGGIIYNSSFFGSPSKSLEFRTNNNTPRMVITGNGNVGIGTTDPGNFKLKIVSGVTDGLALENSFAPGAWEIVPFPSGFGGILLRLRFNGNNIGSFSAITGEYFNDVNPQLQTNLQPMPAVLEKIGQLKPSAYQLSNGADKQTHNGFTAEDVMKVFPSLVTPVTDKESKKTVYSINNSGFGTIAIKGIQELMKINDSLKSQIQNLKSEMSEIKAMLKNNSGSASSKTIINTSLTNASLEQNTPNPFTNLTIIHYTLPPKFTSAQIVITDKSGNTIKKINVSGAGKGIMNVDASALSSGAYSYSLIVDGKLIATKQMVLTK